MGKYGVDEHHCLVAALKKPGQDIINDLTPERINILKQVLNDCITIGADLDVVKKLTVYNKDIAVPYAFREGITPIENLTPEKADLLHMVIGVFGEAAELLEAVVKHTVDDEPLDVENVKEEMGDMEFYQEGVRQNLGISRHSTLKNNCDKLNIRYAKGTFSNEQAQARADKEPVHESEVPGRTPEDMPDCANKFLPNQLRQAAEAHKDNLVLRKLLLDAANAIEQS